MSEANKTPPPLLQRASGLSQGVTSGKTLVNRVIGEVWNQGKLDSADDLIAPDFVARSAPPGSPGGPEGYKAYVMQFRTGFPDLTLTVDQVLVEGDRVAVRLTAQGTHTGPFMGMEPTGVRVSVNSMSFGRVKDGKLVENWTISDMGSLMRQLQAT